MNYIRPKQVRYNILNIQHIHLFDELYIDNEHYYVISYKQLYNNTYQIYCMKYNDILTYLNMLNKFKYFLKNISYPHYKSYILFVLKEILIFINVAGFISSFDVSLKIDDIYYDIQHNKNDINFKRLITLLDGEIKTIKKILKK